MIDRITGMNPESDAPRAGQKPGAALMIDRKRLRMDTRRRNPADDICRHQLRPIVFGPCHETLQDKERWRERLPPLFCLSSNLSLGAVRSVIRPKPWPPPT